MLGMQKSLWTSFCPLRVSSWLGLWTGDEGRWQLSARLVEPTEVSHPLSPSPPSDMHVAFEYVLVSEWFDASPPLSCGLAGHRHGLLRVPGTCLVRGWHLGCFLDNAQMNRGRGWALGFGEE